MAIHRSNLICGIGILLCLSLTACSGAKQRNDFNPDENFLRRNTVDGILEQLNEFRQQSTPLPSTDHFQLNCTDQKRLSCRFGSVNRVLGPRLTQRLANRIRQLRKSSTPKTGKPEPDAKFFLRCRKQKSGEFRCTIKRRAHARPIPVIRQTR